MKMLRVKVALTEEEKTALQIAAKKDRRTLSNLLRYCALKQTQGDDSK